jgi:hypothetical protein
MDARSKEIISRFQQSNTYSWKVEEADVRAAIQTAVETNDVDLLSWFLSNRPQDQASISYGPGVVWNQLCIKDVFPYLAEHANLAAIQLVCDTLSEYPFGVQGFDDSGFYVLEKAGKLAVKPVCNIIDSIYTHIGLWIRAVNFMRDHKEKDAISSIVIGMKNKHPDWSSINIEQSMAIGVQALVALDAPARGDIFYDLLSQDDFNKKKYTIQALGRFGDKQALEALNKRMGGMFKKAETNTSLRGEITEAIKKIKSR